MLGRETSNPSTPTTKPSSSTTTPSTVRSRASSTATSTSAKPPVVTKPGLASKRNSLDPKVLSSAAKPLPIKTTSFSAANTPTVRSPLTAKPPAKLPTQPSTLISGTRSARTSISSRDQLVKASEPVKRTTPASSKLVTTRSTATAPSTPTRDTTRVSRSGSIGAQSSRTATPLTSRSVTPTTASSTKSASTNVARDPSRRSSVGATPSRAGPPIKVQTSTIRSSTAPSSKTQTPTSSSPPTPRVSSRPSSVSLTSKDLPSSRKTKTHTPTASLTSPIPSSSPRSSFSSSSSKSSATAKVAMGPAQSQKDSAVPELVLPASPGVRHASYETNEFKEAVQNEVTPQLIPTQELDDTPQVTSLSPPLDKDENVNISDNVSKAQTDDDVELEDKEQKHHQHQHQVSSTPPPFRTQESPQSPSTPTPTLQLFKEDGPEAVQTICEKQQQQQQQKQEPQPLQKTATQIDYTTMIHSSVLSKDEVIETLYAPEPAPLEAVKQAKRSEICTVVKEELPALDEAEAVVETTGITAVESVEEASISLPSAVEEMEQTEELKPEQDQNQNQEEEEKEEEEKEGSKAVEEVVRTEEESAVVEEKQVVEPKVEGKDVVIAEEEFVLVVKEKENKQEQEDIEVALQDDEVDFEEEEVSASFDAAVLDDSEAIETIDESLLTTEIQGEDQQLQVEEDKLTVMIAEESVESEDFEAPVQQEQVSTQQEVVETVELEEVPLDSVADEAVDSVVPVLDEEVKDICHPEEVATPEILEAASVEQVESTEVLLVGDSASLIESEAVMVDVQAVDVEEIAIPDEDIQDIKVAAQAEVTSLVRESELALEVVKTTEVIEAAHVDENDIVESDIAAIEEEVATESIDEELVIESTDEDIENTETDQLDIENEEQLSEKDTKSEIVEMIVDGQLEIQESIKGAFTEIEVVPEKTSEPESFKKVEIDTEILSLEETIGVLEVSVVESSLEEELEVEVEKVVEKDGIPSESMFLESEATTEISETDASSAEEIPSVADQIDFTCISHKFVWNHGGQSVKVTGTFDNWQASVDLKKNDDAFEAIVGLNRTKLIHFKFVVDGQWLCASDLVTEFDHSGNQNHVLYALV